jgi:DNA invertase Pin-like site-specific DNA recombinase
MLLDAYIRVSRVAGRSGPSFISPLVQRDEIERWAADHRAVVARIFEEFDESGARGDRPLLLEAIRRVEAGESDGLVVAYLSRFGRSLVDALAAIKRITDAGGTFVSVREGLDFSTDTGRLVLRMLFSIAEWEADRVRSNWEEADARAIARGVSVARPPFGYRRGSDRRLEIDPYAGPIVAKMFRRRATGVSLGQLAWELTREGILTPTGRSSWHARRVGTLLNNRTYRGELHYRGSVNFAAHEPLVNEDTWQRAQTKGMPLPAQKTRGPALLNGLLRCAGCQRQLVLSCRLQGSSEEHRYYKCHRECGPRCRSQVSISDATVEPYIEALFWQELRHARPRGATGRVRHLRTRLERREAELVAYRDNARLPGSLGSERFADGVAVRVRRVEEARMALARVRVAAEGPSLPAPPQLAERWADMPVNDRRHAISELIDCVFVCPGHVAPEDRLVVFLRGRAPELVSYDPSDRGPAAPFDPSSAPAGPKLRRTDQEADIGQLRRALEAFLEGHDHWPPFRYFQARGQALLFEAAKRNGGARYWAAQLDLPYKPPNDVAAWTDDQIRRELRTYLEGKNVWPNQKAFLADGKRALATAIQWTGGGKRWAAEMGVQLHWRSRPRRSWFYARMQEEVRALAGDSGLWPAPREFFKAGLSGLERASRPARVRERLLRDLNLTLPPQGFTRPRVWTDERIQAALDKFLDGRQTWPPRVRFAEAGLSGLDRRLRADGTRDAWAARLGFESSQPGSPRLRRVSPR